ncbi:unnamed protein product [Rotaria magnacalcarata]|uniref:Uncharacterized protein n=1 Tax=Rotaria magnacalcarata TaxID=392030 RepID=A0A815Z786_9BILA|nr:unnamed protein product [Rotaria magnacalcarata]CAF1581096.1 unnamed protein product [Rotaria magnacalcarata]CAF4040785.1 unnamed protein product [Rotaria magnacalcarata]CAF4046191.1 unnamed protein product [Rotaria magnacalcarata]CAF4066878.1 unnamed protein product [Rotaria magnacalcarata]
MGDRYDNAVKKILAKTNVTEVTTAIEEFYENITKKVEDDEKNARQARISSTKAQQGQHVINKNIIGFHEYIVTTFINVACPEAAEAVRNAAKDFTNSTNYFNNDQETFITGAAWVCPSGEFYYDSNAERYRAFITLLREAAVQYMMCLTGTSAVELDPSKCKKALTQTCHIMDKKDICVDQMALNGYKKDNKKDGKNYESAKTAVCDMLNNLAKDIEQCANKIKQIK